MNKAIWISFFLIEKMIEVENEVGRSGEEW